MKSNTHAIDGRRKQILEQQQKLRARMRERALRLSQHFGRAPYFTVVELDESGKVLNLQIVPNKSEHFRGVGKPPEIILNLRPNV